MNMKLLLAGTLGIVLLTGLGITPAYATQPTIDNFETENNNCDVEYDATTALIFGSIDCTDTSPMDEDTLGGQRDGTVGVNGGTGTGDHKASISVGEALTEGFISFSSTALTNGFVILKYGEAGDLDQDWSTVFDRIRITLASTDGTIATAITLTEDAGDGGSTCVLNGNLAVPMTDYFLASCPANVNLANIDHVQIRFDGSQMADFTITDISLPVMIGGTMMPADSTALLLAGAELNAIWILPAIAAIGIGAFIVSRKRN